MACLVDDVLKIANEEVGYLEKKNGNINYLYSKTANAGSANYTKYGYEMHKIYPDVMDYPAYWCDAFVDWCFYKAYGIANAKGLLGGNFDDYTIASAQLYKNKGAWHQTPKEGDQAFFKNDLRINHTGLVETVNGNTFTTIEGNTSGGSEVIPNGGAVCRKTYSIDNPRIAGFGRPAYDKQDFRPHWVFDGVDWYWRIEPNKNAHGWQKIQNADGVYRWYHFRDDGRMDYDWFKVGNDWYYGEESGDLKGALWKSDDNGAQFRWEMKD